LPFLAATGKHDVAGLGIRLMHAGAEQKHDR
jgi:hypothetical protein